MIAVLAVAVGAYLISFAWISTSHPISKAAIARSSEVADSVGKLVVVLLVGARQKLVPGGASCSRNTYLVLGDEGFAWVVSELSMKDRQADWSLDHLSVGWSARTVRAC